MRWWLWLVVGLVGCVHPNHVECTDGRVCAPDLLCDDINHTCVVADQLVTCVGSDDGVDCTIDGAPGGVCKNQVCLHGRCGDGFVKGPERCDGANLDGVATCTDLGYYDTTAITCTSDCVFDTGVCGGGRCGDSIVNGPEFCEDGILPAAATCLDFGYDIGRLACATSCTPDFGACESFGFVPAGPSTPNPFTAVWVAAPDAVFAVGDGIVAHYDGSVWTTEEVTAQLRAVGGSSATDVWAVGANAAILHFDGTTWTPSTLAGAGTLTTVWARSATEAYVGGSGATGPSIIGHWNGTMWTIEVGDVPWTPSAVTGLASTTDVFVVGEHGLYMHKSGGVWGAPLEIQSDPGGLTDQYWQFSSLIARGPDDLWAGANGWIGGVAPGGFLTGALVHITNATTGQSSQVVPEGTTTSPFSLKGKRIEALSDTGSALFLASDVGVGIHEGLYTRLVPAPATSISGTADDLWVVTQFGSLRRFRGNAWLAQPLHNSAQMYAMRALSASSDGYVIAGGDSMTPSWWDGDEWSAGRSAPTDPPALPAATVTAFSAPADGTVFAVTEDGYIKKTTGGQNFWSNIGSVSPVPWRDVWAANASEAMAVGDGGRAWWISNTTATPTFTAASGVDFLGVWGTSTTNIYAVGGMPGTPGQGTVKAYDSQNTAWTVVDVPVGTPLLEAIWGPSATDFWVVGEDGFIARRTGATWLVTQLDGPQTLTCVTGTSATDVFAAGYEGVLYHYDGTSWSRVRSPTTANINAIVARGGLLFLAADDGTHILYRAGL